MRCHVDLCLVVRPFSLWAIARRAGRMSRGRAGSGEGDGASRTIPARAKPNPRPDDYTDRTSALKRCDMTHDAHYMYAGSGTLLTNYAESTFQFVCARPASPFCASCTCSRSRGKAWRMSAHLQLARRDDVHRFNITHLCRLIRRFRFRLTESSDVSCPSPFTSCTPRAASLTCSGVRNIRPRLA